MNRLWTFIKSIYGISIGIISFLFNFMPESFFAYGFMNVDWSRDVIIFSNRILLLFAISLVTTAVVYLCRKYRKKETIRGNDYTVRVEYEDIMNVTGCKRVISFDECFTTKIGKAPQDINEDSICGQYLRKNPIPDISRLISQAGVTPAAKPSKYKSQPRYTSGTIVPRGDDLLLAFVPLDENGSGSFDSIADYMESLSRLWCELDKHHGQKDVCISILGSGTTRVSDSTEKYSQQELLDLMILSYKKSRHKLQSNSTLRIICQRNDNFSLNNIGVR